MARVGTSVADTETVAVVGTETGHTGRRHPLVAVALAGTARARTRRAPVERRMGPMRGKTRGCRSRAAAPGAGDRGSRTLLVMEGDGNRMEMEGGGRRERRRL